MKRSERQPGRQGVLRRILVDLRDAWRDPSIPPDGPRLQGYPLSRG